MPDPYLLLGVARDADDATVRDAYLKAIKSCPPERDGQRFEAIRAAYELIGDHRARINYELFNTDPPSVIDVLDLVAPVGPQQRPGAALFAALLQVKT